MINLFFVFDRYFKYVKGLASKGCFKHPAYLLKKREALDGNDGKKGKHVWAGNKYVREIIPQCVVKLVRQFYPNPSGKGYDGEGPLFKIYDKEDKEKGEGEKKEENGVMGKVD